MSFPSSFPSRSAPTRTSFALFPNATVLALALLTSTGCWRSNGPPRSTPPQPTVEVASPLLKNIVEWNDFTGRLQAVDRVEVRSRVSGYLQSIKFEEGQDVEKDALLYVIDPRPFEVELAQAQAALKEAKARLEQSQALLAQAQADKKSAESQLALTQSEYDRQQPLVEQRAVSQSEFNETRTAYFRAQAGLEAANAGVANGRAAIATSTAAIEAASTAVELAELNLEYTQIRSPIKGRIGQKRVTEGNLINGGSAQSTLLTTIVSRDPIYVTFEASEDQVLRFKRMVQQGSRQSVREVRYPAHLGLADEEGFPHHGFIDFVDNQFDTNTATLTARARFPNNDDLLTSGMFGKVRLANTLEYEAMLVPDSAIGFDQSEQFVYVVDSQGKATPRTVVTGPLSHGLRVIRSGIEPTDRIVIEGLQRLRPGVTVQTDEATIVAEEETIDYDFTPVARGQDE